jgi:hypothetical protein
MGQRGEGGDEITSGRRLRAWRRSRGQYVNLARGQALSSQTHENAPNCAVAQNDFRARRVFGEYKKNIKTTLKERR